MEQQLVELASSHGLWSLLFVVLFIYTITDSRKREQRYQITIEKNQKIINENQSIISNLSKNQDVINRIQQDVSEIKIKVERN